jgi:hypothetical protein
VVCAACPPGEDQEKGKVVGPYPSFFSSVDSARYRGDSLFSIKIVKNKSPQSSCRAPARACCGGGKDEGFILSDEHKLDLLPPLPHFRLIHRSSKTEKCSLKFSLGMQNALA